MKLSSLFALILPAIVLLACYIFIQLNQNVIAIDLLFIDLEVKAGLAVIFSFISGIFIALIFELMNHLRKRQALKDKRSSI